MEAKITFQSFINDNNNNNNNNNFELFIDIPLPEKRPKLITNFMYLCSGAVHPFGNNNNNVISLIQTEFLQQQFNRTFTQNINYNNNNNNLIVYDNLFHFLEFGVSHFQTVFGGFIEEECLLLQELNNNNNNNNNNMMIAQALEGLKRGLLFNKNAGRPHTLGSRYLLLLEDFNEDHLLSLASKNNNKNNYKIVKEEWKEMESLLRQYTPVGYITNTEVLISLKQFLEGQINNNNNNNKKKVPNGGLQIVYSEVQKKSISFDAFNFNNNNNNVMKEYQKKGPLNQRNKRGRGDAEDDEDNNNNENENDGGFFSLSSRNVYNQNNNNKKSKKFRGEEFFTRDEEGNIIERNTALMSSSDFNSNNNNNSNFNFFEAQKGVFFNNLEEIKEVQQKRMHNRTRKNKNTNNNNKFKNNNTNNKNNNNNTNKSNSVADKMAQRLLGKAPSKNKKKRSLFKY